MLKWWALWRSRKRIVAVAYVALGVIVAQTHGYLAHVRTLTGVLSAALAVALWPLVLLGIDLHVH
jgi:hypothetical protein